MSLELYNQRLKDSPKHRKLTGDSEDVRHRQDIEQKIVIQFVKDAIKAGYFVCVDDGEEVSKPSKNIDTVFKALFNTDLDQVGVCTTEKHSSVIGWVMCVYGNDGWDVISDYHVNLEPMMANCNKLSERYSR